MRRLFTESISCKANMSRNRNYVWQGSIYLMKRMWLILIIIIGDINSIDAVPSYARQTGLSCSACHIAFPNLNSFGRQFKLNGYTLATISTIDDTDDRGKNKLKLLSFLPLSAMTQLSVSTLNKKEPGTQNINFEFPQQFSMFLSGLIAPKFGIFTQFTYDQQGAAFGMDNVDIRYAGQTKLAARDLTYGFTLNNNPTVQDLWNSTPAWSFPYASSAVAPEPSAATLLDGGLAQQVAGIGTYALFSNFLYAEFSIYRSAQQGAPDPPDATSEMIIKGVAPYWRIALQHQWSNDYLELGMLGLTTGVYPAGVTDLTDKYTDLGFDLQFEHSLSKANIILHTIWIHEMQKMDASFQAGSVQNEKNNLSSLKVDGSIYFKSGLGFTLAYYNVMGSRDPEFYAPESVSGSRTGKPDSDGFTLQMNYNPWHNVQFSLQYVYNNKFNGARSNYDGFNRDASANNCLYLLTWINF